MATIKDKIKRRNKNVPHELIATIVSNYFDIDQETIFNSKKDRSIIPARRIAFLLMRTFCGIGITNIGNLYGHKKNLVMFDTLKAYTLIKKDKEFARVYKEVKDKVFLKTNGLRKNVPSYPSHYGLKKLIKERNI